MKWIFVSLILVINSSLVAQDFSSQLQSATAAFDQGQPATAAAIYDTIRAQGYVSPTLYLAQGNAYLAANDLGRSILAYERGLRLKPAHRDLTNNLKFAEQQLETVLVDLPGFFLQRWWKWLGSRVGTTLSYSLAVLFWWAAVAAFAIWFFKRAGLSEKRRFALLPAAGLLLIVAVAFYFLGNSRNAELNRTDQAVLISPTAPLTVAPGPEATLEQELTAGQRLKIIDDYQGKYFKVILRDGKQGWLAAKDLEVI